MDTLSRRFLLLALGLVFVACTAQVGVPGTGGGSDDDGGGNGSGSGDDDTTDPTDATPSWQQEFIGRDDVSVDILVAVDDSCSMFDEQQALIANSDSFINAVESSGLDYHLGLVRLDLSQNPPGRMVGTPAYITPATLDPVGDFNARVSALGSDGSGACESGLAAIYYALTEPEISGENAGFLRPEAGLAVLLISDEEEQSRLGCGMEQAGPDVWPSWLYGLKNNLSEQVAVGIIAGYSAADHSTPAACNGAGGSAQAGNEYDVVAQATNALTWSICDLAWDSFLEDFAEAAVATSPFAVYPLQQAPAVDVADFDDDGDTSERAIQVFIDKDDGLGPINVQPEWAANPDPNYPWTWVPKENALRFTGGRLPRREWFVIARYLPEG